MTSHHKIVACVAGLKGLHFVESLLATGCRVSCITSYKQTADHAGSFERLRDIATRSEVDFVDSRYPELNPGDLNLIVGWQFLLSRTTPSTVIFHDSLLPRYRGFAPTVTALIKGDNEIGVTAIIPTDERDAGPVLGQRSQAIQYPIKIEAALIGQASLMVKIATSLIEDWKNGALSPRPQSSTGETFSIWRDGNDYEIDWTQDSDRIKRTIDALGFPYDGAKTSINGGDRIRLDDATVVPDLDFEIRDIGKVWTIDDGRPVVVCGRGMLRLDKCCSGDGSRYRFDRLRMRLGS